MIYICLTGFLIGMSHLVLRWCSSNINSSASALSSLIVLGNFCPSLQQLHLFAAHRLLAVLPGFLTAEGRLGLFVELLRDIPCLRKGYSCLRIGDSWK